MTVIIEKNKELLYKLTLFFDILYLYGVTAYGISSLKYMGLYGAILFFLLLVAYDTKSILESYKEVWQVHKTLLIGMLLLMLSIFVSMYFSYTGLSMLLKGYRTSFLNPSIFVIILLGIQKQNKKTVTLLFIALCAALIQDIVSFGVKYWHANPHFDLSIQFNRQFSFYFDYLFPFGLVAIFYLRNKIKFLITSIIIVGLVELFLTGARGAWITVLFSTILIVSLIFYYRKSQRKKMLQLMFLFLVLTSVSFYFTYTKANIVKSKVAQGLNTSGRDIIVKERLPIFIEHGNKLIGFGGPSSIAYNKFFNDHGAPHHVGKMENGTFHFFTDEPFLLNVFYEEGLVGLFLFLYILFYLSYKLLLLMMKINKDTIMFYFVLALFTSFISYYFVRGLVEHRSFSMLLYYIAMYIISYQSYTKENKSNKLQV